MDFLNQPLIIIIIKQKLVFKLRASTRDKLYSLCHLDTAECSPLPDMRGANRAQAICTFILNSIVHCDRRYRHAFQVFGIRRNMT